MTRRIATLVTAAALMTLLAACGSESGSDADRQDAVREAGASVMPFSLDETEHSFVNTGDGGVQTVVALDPEDTRQIDLIRHHLREVSGEFAAGTFDDPMTIHGADMPGVQELAAGADRIQIEYHDVDGGGQITYRSTDAALVGALHDWFDAQLSDHGSDAVSVPVDGAMTEEMWHHHHPGQPYPGTTDGG